MRNGKTTTREWKKEKWKKEEIKKTKEKIPRVCKKKKKENMLKKNGENKHRKELMTLRVDKQVHYTEKTMNEGKYSGP